VIQAWERDDASQGAEYRWDLGSEWDGLSWRPSISVNQNILYIDSLTEFSFSEIK
jgi:hypothetical protein